MGVASSCSSAPAFIQHTFYILPRSYVLLKSQANMSDLNVKIKTSQRECYVLKSHERNTLNVDLALSERQKQKKGIVA